MNSSEAVVSFENVHHRFGGVCAVDDFNVTVHRGERVAILGRTGAGKSTVLNLLVGNLRATEGSVTVAGRDPYVDHTHLQGVIGMAFQSPRLLPWRTALDNVAIGNEILRIGKEERERRAREWLAKMHLDGEDEKYPAELSGGMRQRVSLARAFSVNPALVLLDESFSALDEVTAKALRDDFVELAEEQSATALIVTHNIEEAFAVAHRVIVLGRPARILAEYHPATLPRAGAAEFQSLRSEIHEKMKSAQGEALAPG